MPEARNIMTWATLLITAAAVLMAIVEVVPQSEALGLAKVSIVAGAAGRALVFAVKEWAAIYAVASVGGESDDTE